MTHSDNLADLFAALSAAQAEIRHAAKDCVGQVGQQKTRYADLAGVWDAVREALTRQKLSVVQGVSADGPRVTVTTMLGHASGQWLAESLTMTAQSASPQAVGSAITYGRRYGLSALVGVSPDDDDGHAASQSAAPKAQANGRPPAAAVNPPNAPAPAEQPKATVSQKLHAFAAIKETKGLSRDGHCLAWLREYLGDFAAISADDAREACEQYERRQKAGEFDAPKHQPEPEEVEI